MKVLHVVGGLPSPAHPSLQPFVARQIESLRQAGLELDVLDLSAFSCRGWNKYLCGAVELRRRMASSRYDIIHAHYSYCGYVARCQARHPVVLSLMGSDLLGVPDFEGDLTLRGKIDIRISQLIMKCSDHIIVKSEDMARSVPANLKVSVVPNGVDLQMFRPMDREECRRHCSVTTDEKVVLFAADPVNPRKNYRLAREAVDLLQSRGRFACQLWTFCKRSQQELPYAMNAADALLMTSFMEGSPNVVKESMACNLPVVSVRVGDVPQVIGNARNCHLCDYDAADLAGALEQVLAAKGRSDGREQIQHLSLESVADRVVQIYRQEIEAFRKRRKG